MRARSITLVITIAAALAVSASSTTATEEPVLDPVPSGDRVELPEMGIAVTFPGGWTREMRFGGQTSFSDGDSYCLPVGVTIDEPVADPDATLDRAAEIFPVFSDDGPLPVIDTTEVTLPAGRAVRFVSDLSLDPVEMAEPGARYSTTYLMTNGRVLVFFGCWSDERPADDWEAIAATIEYLPEPLDD